MYVKRRTVRVSQTIAPFGVGAVYDVFGESFVGCDITRWGKSGVPVFSEALSQLLGVALFKSAPDKAEDPYGIPYMRFPQWLFCQKCRKLLHWKSSYERLDRFAICDDCVGNRRLIPMRFVVACRNGHLSDMDWIFWAHSQRKRLDRSNCQSPSLKFRSRSSKASTGLNSLEVICTVCNASRSLAGITANDSLSKLKYQCPGGQPWASFGTLGTCDETPHVLQRGASNLYFAHVTSALEIPGRADLDRFGTTRAAIESNTVYKAIRGLNAEQKTSPFYDYLMNILIEGLNNIAREDVEAVMALGDKAYLPKTEIDISGREWLALCTPQTEETVSEEFITRPASLFASKPTRSVDVALDAAFDRIMLVTKLKEVRVLQSFSRIAPDAYPVRPDLSEERGQSKMNWLPAIQVYGEGIFLTFNEQLVKQWEQQPAVQARFAALKLRLAKSQLGTSIIQQRLAAHNLSPRFIMLHTFAHLLVREFCFECGYSSAALRERIYSRADGAGAQAGVLIYTAAGDSEGTLGGIVRQGESPRLADSVLRAIEAAIWCSADPICRESDGQGYDKTNLAACHACCLLPETSCVCGNMLLDRSMLIEAGPQRSGIFADFAMFA